MFEILYHVVVLTSLTTQYLIQGNITPNYQTVQPNGMITPCHHSLDLHHHGLDVDCSHRGFVRVPRNLPGNTTSLNLIYNELTILYNNDFHNLVQLRYLDLSFNSIKEIQVMSFTGLSSLLTLYIFYHDLNYTEASVPEDVFRPLVSLQVLTLRSDISRFQAGQLVLPDKAIGCLHNLTSLDIDTTSNTVFSPGFSNLRNLRHLNIGFSKHIDIGLSCGLKKLNNCSFKAFLNTSVERLQLNGCHFLEITSNSLTPFPKLQIFEMKNGGTLRGNPADILRLFDIYMGKTMSSISIYNLSRGPVSSIGHGHGSITFKNISQICLAHLDLTNSSINFMDTHDLFSDPLPPFTQCIKSLKLSKNFIIGMFPWSAVLFLKLIPNLEIVDLSLQARMFINQYNPRSFEPFTNKTIGFPLYLPPQLRYINIAGFTYTFGRFVDVYVLNGNNLSYLNMSYCGIYSFNHIFVGIENLATLDLSGNDLSTLKDIFFETLPNLTTLRLSWCLIGNDFLNVKGKKLFKPLTKLQNLDLSNNGLIFLAYDLFDSLTTLKCLNLAYNSLISIPDVSTLLHLNFIYLDFNSLTTITNQYRTMLDQSKTRNPGLHLHIIGNIFSCGCASSEFLLWLEETTVDLDGRNYTCIDMTGQLTTTKAINQRSVIYYRKCNSAFWMIMATTGMGIVLLSLITAFVFIKNKMKFKILLLRLIGQNVYPKKREEFIYDGYVIYTDSTIGFVFKDLRRELETNRGVNLNLRDRDHLPGGYEPDDIQIAIRDSWKVILILTDEFLQSDLSYFIMCNCLSAITLTTPNRLIILVDEQTRIPVNIDFLLEPVSQDNIVYIDLQAPAPPCFWDKLYRIVSTIPQDH